MNETPALIRGAIRETRNMAMDSRRWDGFVPRPGDVVVATYQKCGTTWMQRIVDMLIHQSTDPRPIMETYPWLDATMYGPIEPMLAMLDAQTHRRSIKSHLPFDSLPVYDGVRYIHVARDGRDACLSMHNHRQGVPEALIQQMRAASSGKAASGLSNVPAEPRDFFLQWIADAEAGGSSSGMLSFFEFEKTYWAERARPNLLLVHHADLLADLKGEMARISAFLGIDTPSGMLDEIAKAGDFAAMKAEGAALLPQLGEQLDHGHQRFLNKGTNGRWKGVLTQDDIARYEKLIDASLTRSAANWLEHGRLVAGDPRTSVEQRSI